ncbi:hypothetical protein JYU34_021371 [Plutella xylostella]|uniref:Pre-rRNA-processing protein RIX1 N-terminal domain-containing protein n=1 Tax=Plutella xylostella TaxID=51655 RepID=A0ABQ7PTE9_PLUXY|nr:hypothetical protein JYU34_021371 [Plutella xylostella]
MSQILNKIREVDPHNSDAVKDVLSVFFQNLPKHIEVGSSQWLRALEYVINRFPKYCMTHRNTIETFLTNFLDTKNYYNVIEAAKCGHALQQVRPSQEKTATPKTSWREQMELLCRSAHSLIGAIFTNDVLKNGGYYQSDSDSVPPTSPLSVALSKLKDVSAHGPSAEEKNELLCTRLRNVFVFIQAMLVEVYPVAKPIRPQTIFDVTVRALTASSGSNQTLSGTQLALIKTQALRTLDAMAACLGSNLIPFSPLMIRLAMQTIRWTAENPSDETREIRCQAYRSLSSWLSRLKTHKASGTWPDELVTRAVEDITPTAKTIQLTMSSQPTKNMSKKAKRKLANSMLMDSNIASHMPGEKNKTLLSDESADEVAIAALECIEIFLTVCGTFLKPSAHKLLQTALVRCSAALSLLPCRRGVALCRALDAARIAAPPTAPPPTQHCLQIYSDGVHSPHEEISRICSQALLNIRLHLHCSPPSLNFAIEAPAESKEPAAVKTVSENRAALEALLGPDKMPPNGDAKEVITIVDEPSRKKARLSEDVDDKISVSSQDSVEIQENSDTNAESTGEVAEVAIEVDDIDGKSNESPDINEIDVVNGDINEEIEPAVAVNTSSAIYDATTQLPVDESVETIDDEASPKYLEVAYDFPNTGKNKVTVLEKMDDENLPSTNETDDIHITCGQQLKSSQDVSQKKSEEIEVKLFEPKLNGIEEETEVVLTNGHADPKENIAESTIIVKIADGDEGVTVEDMLADFVDEVNEEVVNVDA